MGMIKTAEHIEKIKYSSRILGELLFNLRSMIKPGMNCLKIDKYAEDYIRDHKGTPSFKGFKDFPTATCISVNEDIIHGIPKDYELKEGDIVGVDVGMNYNGGFGDTAYTYAVGEINEEKKKLREVTEKSLYVGIEQCYVGNRVGDISNAIQKFVEPQGYTLVQEYCGHGVGEDVWEEPSIPNVGKAGIGPRLKSGMVIAIEPMVNLGSRHIILKKDGWTVSTRDKKPSAHFEHTILITNNGPEVLTKVAD